MPKHTPSMLTVTFDSLHYLDERNLLIEKWISWQEIFLLAITVPTVLTNLIKSFENELHS